MRRKSITSEMMKSYIAESLLLLMEKKNFQDITVGEIVEKAGVNRSTYYRHFNKKEDIVLYFLDNLSKTILEQGNAQNQEFKDYLVKMYEHYYKHRKQMLTIYRNGLSVLFLEVLKKYLGAENHKNEQTSLQYHIAFHIGGTFNQFMLWFSRDMKDTPETMAEYTLAVLPRNYVDHIFHLTFTFS